MYLRISPISVSKGVHKGLANQISYLEKENHGKPLQEQEHFFNQHQEKIAAERVLEDLSSIKRRNFAKGHPYFYNLIVSPSQNELIHIQNQTTLFKKYTSEVMKDYAAAFHRERNGKPITVNDIKYYAKVEHHRYFTRRDHQVRENAPFLKRIKELTKEIRKIEHNQLPVPLLPLHKELEGLKAAIPHKLGDQPIRPGLAKPGYQTHAHVIVSRRDASNSMGLSPGSPQRVHKRLINGRWMTRGFNRDEFYQRAEERFDKLLAYPRNYVETYSAMKTLKRDPQEYYRELQALPPKEKQRAFQILEKSALNLSPKMTQLALKHLEKAISTYNRSASIEY